jgi:hypothetical protein
MPHTCLVPVHPLRHLVSEPQCHQVILCNRNRSKWNSLSKTFQKEGYEEQYLAEASHIALAGADDTIDMELDINEADVKVGSIMTAAQSRVHSHHVL